MCSYIIYRPGYHLSAHRFHFGSIAHDNDALSSDVLSIIPPKDAPSTSQIDVTPSPILLDGSQRVRKFNRTYDDDVRILLALYRIGAKNVDIVFSANIPTKTEKGTGLDPDQVNEARDAFLLASRSLKIKDLSLFSD